MPYAVIYKPVVATCAVFEHALSRDRLDILDDLKAVLPPEPGHVQSAMRYAVLGAGQRLRPMLALRVARVLGPVADSTRTAGAAIELLHCASLIVDDLPCMDNDAVRRNRASVHVEFGEATAVLAAFALVALAARSVAAWPEFQIQLLSTLDCSQLIQGQSLDLALTGRSRDLQRPLVTDLKTVPLFKLAIRAGLLSSRASRDQQEALFSFGHELGAAYQILDDYLDGEIADSASVDRQFSRARSCLNLFGSLAYPLEGILDYLNGKIFEENRRNR